MNAEIPNREFTLNYKVDDVKKAIHEVGDIIGVAGFAMAPDSRNDILGLYSIHVFKSDSIIGLVSGSIKLSVQEVEGAKTKIMVSGICTLNDHGARKIMEWQDYILNQITKALTGTLNAEQVKQENAGCFGVLIILIGCAGVLGTAIVWGISYIV